MEENPVAVCLPLNLSHGWTSSRGADLTALARNVVLWMSMTPSPKRGPSKCSPLEVVCRWVHVIPGSDVQRVKSGVMK